MRMDPFGVLQPVGFWWARSEFVRRNVQLPRDPI